MLVTQKGGQTLLFEALTGFDQPLLHSMYVDKRLAGIQAVQTLSRLNRTTRGKTDTFILDFVNEPTHIYAAFKPYYEVTPKGDDTDPQQLNTLAHTLANWKIYPAKRLMIGAKSCFATA